MHDVNKKPDSLYDCSDPPSLDSSFENLRLHSDSDNNEIEAVNESLETHTVLEQNFPCPAFLKDQHQGFRRRVLNYPFEQKSPLLSLVTPLPDTSSIPSPLETIEIVNTSTPQTQIETPIPSPYKSPSASNPRTSKFTRSQKNKGQTKIKTTIIKKIRIQKRQFVWA